MADIVERIREEVKLIRTQAAECQKDTEDFKRENPPEPEDPSFNCTVCAYELKLAAMMEEAANMIDDFYDW